jgi:hypothetical protein
VAPKQVGDNIGPLVLLWTFRDHMTQRIAFEPYGGKVPHAKRGRENTTPPLPAEVVGPLIQFAWRVVEHYADDVIAIEDAATRLQERIDAAVFSRYETDGLSKIREYCEALAKAGRRMPVWKNPYDKDKIEPFRPYIAAEAGVSAQMPRSPAERRPACGCA